MSYHVILGMPPLAHVFLLYFVLEIAVGSSPWTIMRAFPPPKYVQEYKGFVAFFMDHCKKRSNTRLQAPGGSSLGVSLLEGLRWEHPPLKQRLAEVSAFRQQHENLRSVLQAVLSDDDRTAVAEVQIETV